jgi:hypothetical protein
MRAGAMWLLHLLTVRALGQSWREQMIVRPPRACPPLGMSPFWIWHFLPLSGSFTSLTAGTFRFLPQTHTLHGGTAEFCSTLIVF